MGLRGPQPKPTALRRLEGNPSNRPLNEAEPQPVGELQKPEHITGPYAEEWDRAVSAMPPGFYTAADVPLLAEYSVKWVFLRQANATVSKEGQTTKGSQGQTVQHPAVATSIALGNLILKLAAQLGMSPAARARLQMPEEDPHGEFAGLLGGQRHRASGEAIN